MITWEFIKAMIGSTTGPNRECRGSKIPQLESCFCTTTGLAPLSANAALDASRSPFLRFPPLDLSFEPMVLAREREERPSLRALTKSLA